MKKEMVAILLPVEGYGRGALNTFRDQTFTSREFLIESVPGLRVLDREEFAGLWNTNQLYVPEYWCTWAWIEAERDPPVPNSELPLIDYL